MIWIAFQLAGSALLTAAGVRAARKSRRFATVVVGVMLALILAKNALSWVPIGEPRFLPFNWYPLVERWWYLFPAMLIFGVAITLFRASIWRRDALLVGAGVMILHCTALGWVNSRASDLLGTVGEDGFCAQTSGYSCGAASAVMLLHRHGVTATEREMAELSLTSNGELAGGGTTESGLMRGLRLKLDGNKVPRIDCPTYDALPAPSIVGLRLSRHLSHSILVVQVTDTEVKVLDPLYGKGPLCRGEFERDWLGSAIWIEE
ncbi:MAG TPA: cysteine peptidase family C39 domain-containing protein [Planctomycetota bacterium]|nr:cysteine peptidase family C39 domain-containing protein [Planctomycetota bacterium]